jgi:hypothetical protein
MVYARIDEISRNPLACAVVAGRYRRGLGLFHSARRPATTAGTLEDRDGHRPDQE